MENNNERTIQHGDYYTCKRIKLLKFLLDKGFTPEYDMPDPTNPVRYKWWRFKNSVELEDAITEYFMQY